MQELKDRLHGLRRLYKLAKTKMLLVKIEELELEIHKLAMQGE